MGYRILVPALFKGKAEVSVKKDFLKLFFFTWIRTGVYLLEVASSLLQYFENAWVLRPGMQHLGKKCLEQATRDLEVSSIYPH